jgi:RNA polymerase sigma factor (sigma-70 family)
MRDIITIFLLQCALAHRVPNRQIADVTQTVWADMIDRFPNWESMDEKNLRPWLYVAVRNKAVDLNREKRRHPTKSLRSEEGGQKPSGPDDNPVLSAEKEENARWVHATIDDPKNRFGATNGRILHMLYHDRLTVAEIAKELGMTKAQVHGRKKRMLEKLRVLAEEHFRQDIEDESR